MLTNQTVLVVVNKIDLLAAGSTSSNASRFAPDGRNTTPQPRRPMSKFMRKVEERKSSRNRVLGGAELGVADGVAGGSGEPRQPRGGGREDDGVDEEALHAEYDKALSLLDSSVGGDHGAPGGSSPSLPQTAVSSSGERDEAAEDGDDAKFAYENTRTVLSTQPKSAAELVKEWAEKLPNAGK